MSAVQQNCAETETPSPLRICAELDDVQSVCLYDMGSSYSILSNVQYNEVVQNTRYSGQKQYSRYRGNVPISA